MNQEALNKIDDHIKNSTSVLVIQAENPDGDSLGSSLALEGILSEMGKKVQMYCPVEIPKYLRYATGWDRVVSDFPTNFDLSIIVDTSSATLLERAIVPENLAQLTKHPIVVIDHHLTESDLPFDFTEVNNSKAVATSEIIFDLAEKLSWPLPSDACESMLVSIMSDSLGLASEGTTANSVFTVAKLMEKGAKISDIENRRRDFMKKSPEILEYKGKLIQRIEYHANGALALVHIPWDEIEEYSDQYNPSVLVLDEMRLVEGVRLAVAFKSYPDGKITGKLRANADAKIAETVAKFFGGGGHPYAAGFRVYGNYEEIKIELIGAVDKALKDHDANK
ncbi:MAG TPA: DHH family phosphoesterase [Candidatus Saccharimonadales bacterium]|nr:DHH family phosphoesterase [Candidatus Saccharimonadales bacterium]